MGCGVTLKLLIFIFSMNLSIGKAAEREQEAAYVVDPVGNILSKPSKVPAPVGSPSHLIRPDRYEFYTFDETGELIKRLMTLQEIQEIIAMGDGDDGHMLTIAHTDSSKPPITFNLQPPTNVKVHTIVNSVQNVLKAEMEAQKTNPPKPAMFDTPDVSSSWSMILPAIFGNTGGSIAPDNMVSSHVEPETDVINVPNTLETEDEMFDDADVVYETTITPIYKQTKKPETTTKTTLQHSTSTPSTVKISSVRPVPYIDRETVTERIHPPTVPVKISTIATVETTAKPVTEKIVEITTKREPLTTAQMIKIVSTTTQTPTTASVVSTQSTTSQPITTTVKIQPILNKVNVKNITHAQNVKESIKTTAVPLSSTVTTTTTTTTAAPTTKTEKTTTTTAPTTKTEKPTTTTVRIQSTSTTEEIPLSEIINKIAMDLNDGNDGNLKINSLMSSTEVPKSSTTTTSTTTTTTTTTQKSTTTPNTTTKTTPSTTTVETSSKITPEAPTTEKLISTHRPLGELAYIKITPIEKNYTDDLKTSTSKISEIITEPNRILLDSVTENDYLERTTAADVPDTTRPNLHELSGSITDLISQIVDGSKPTILPVANKVTPNEEYYTLMSTLNPVERVTNEPEMRVTAEDSTEIENLPTEQPTELPQRPEMDKNENGNKSSLVIVVQDLEEQTQPTTYRPIVPLFVRSTKPPMINEEEQLISNPPAEDVQKNISFVKIEDIKVTTETVQEVTTIPPDDDEDFEEDVELVTGDTFIEEYETTTEGGPSLNEDEEMMDLISQVSKIFQIESQPNLEQTYSNKKTSYKKTDESNDQLQASTEKRTEETTTFKSSSATENVQKEEKVEILNRISAEKPTEEKIILTEVKTEVAYKTDKPTNVQTDYEPVKTTNNAVSPDKNATVKSDIKGDDGAQKPVDDDGIELTIESSTHKNNDIKSSPTTARPLEKIEISPTTAKLTLTTTTKLPESTTVLKKLEITSTQPTVTSDHAKTTEKYVSSTVYQKIELPTTATPISDIKLDHIVPVNNTEIRVNSVNQFAEPERNSTWKLVPTISSNDVPTSYVKVTTTTPKYEQKFNRVTVTSSQYTVENQPSSNVLKEKEEPQGLEKTTATLGRDVYEFSQLCNELAFRYWKSVSSNGIDPKRSLVVSPFAVTSLLAMIFLGARGATSGEMNDILKLDEMVTFNPHIVFKNVTESIEISKGSGVATSAFVRELYSDKSKGRLLSFYKDRAQQFYGGHVEEINFNAIGDIVRRRTNLLVKRQTRNKIPEYIKGNNMMMRPPLSVFAANVFQTDCSVAYTDNRNGEMYFVVSPSIRQRRLIPVPAVLYKDNFLAGYVPELDATVAAVGGGEQMISTIFAMPGQQGSTAHGDSIIDLQDRIIDTSFRDKTWSKLLRSLKPRPGLELQIPRFSHRSVENGSYALQRMGLRDLFSADKADLRGLNGVSNDLYLSDMTMVNTFTTCGEGYIADQHHVEVYPGEPNKAQRRLWRTPHRPVVQDIINGPILSDLLDEPRDYQRAFHDPLYDNSYLSMPLHLRPRQARLPDQPQEQPKLKFDRPFMFFVRHNPTGLILHMGRYNPRLLP